MASTSTSLRPPPTAPRLVCGRRRRPLGPNSLSPFPLRSASSARVGPRSFCPVSAATSSDSPWEREEARWLREEQRWLREEQRWMREESRWRAEREALLREVAGLRLRIEALEGGLPGHLEAVVVDKAEERRIDAGEARPALVENAQVKEMILEEAKVVGEKKDEKKETEKEIGRRTLRMGSEGDDVREMQEALQRLGFYSGEEDMEFASFSSGTERAVKTWQATVGTSQDGIMTTKLLERLFLEQTVGGAVPKDGPNGAAVASLTEVTEVQEKAIKDSGDSEVKASQQRVFLLGENRWEEPSRLIGRNKPQQGSKAASSTKCLSCRGEGKLLCTECDGTGEPNIEPQFLEWVGEGTKCPYCEGLGYTICDVCEGKSVVDA